MNTLNVFMVDDHQFILEGYKSILKLLLTDNNFEITEAKDCQTSFEAIFSSKNDFDFAFIDWSIPAYEREHLFSGEDIAHLIKKQMPKCKIIIISSFSEIIFIEKVLNNLDPDGFMIKNECSPTDFVTCVNAVLDNKRYYSKTVSNYIEKPIKYYQLDNVDLIILEKLSKGIKTVNLPDHTGLTLSGLEKRKNRLKFKLDVSGNDEKLIEIARNLGLV